MKKIVLTGGGTAGHVNPNLALIPKLRTLGYDILYIGSQDGIEHRLMDKAKIPYEAIAVGKLRRYRDLRNVTDPFRVMRGYAQCLRILRREKPSVVFSKGGYVSVPVVLAARTLRIPILAHESDLTPGLANRITHRFVDKLLVTFPETLPLVGEKGILVGSPIREELFKGDRKQGLALAGLTEAKPVILFMGGSIGSVKLNEAVRNALPRLLSHHQVIHLCGGGNMDLALAETAGYAQFEYVQDEMKDLLAAADMVVSRAGSNSIFEFLALKKPHLLIPLSLSASRGDQIENAKSFQTHGYSMVLWEEELTPESLLLSLEHLHADRERYVAAMQSSKLQSAVDTVVELIERHSR